MSELKNMINDILKIRPTNYQSPKLIKIENIEIFNTFVGMMLKYYKIR